MSRTINHIRELPPKSRYSQQANYTKQYIITGLNYRVYGSLKSRVIVKQDLFFFFRISYFNV